MRKANKRLCGNSESLETTIFFYLFIWGWQYILLKWKSKTYRAMNHSIHVHNLFPEFWFFLNSEVHTNPFIRPTNENSLWHFHEPQRNSSCELSYGSNLVQFQVFLWDWSASLLPTKFYWLLQVNVLTPKSRKYNDTLSSAFMPIGNAFPLW